MSNSSITCFLQDVAQFLEGAGAASDSEAEDEISRVRNAKMNQHISHVFSYSIHWTYPYFKGCVA